MLFFIKEPHPVAKSVITTTAIAASSLTTIYNNTLDTINSTANATHDLHKRSIENHTLRHADLIDFSCRLDNGIMGNLVQQVSPFLFPCTIEYSLICAVILFEMWKKVKSIPNIVKTRKNSLKNQQQQQRNAHHFSIDCSRYQTVCFCCIAY